MHFTDPRIHPYLPSIQPMWVKTFNSTLYDYRDHIPFGSFRSLDEFNWYDGHKPRFRHSSGLYSPGHANLDVDKARKQERMLYERDRNKTFLLVDSGGYQVGKGVWSLDELDNIVPKVIKWQEAISDLAVILEVPTWMKIDGKEVEFDFALKTTNRLLEAYAAHATGAVKFLVPLHGLDFEQGKRWFDATRWFVDKGHAVGWCMSSIFSANFDEALRIITYMIEQEHCPRYIHILGRGQQQAAIIADIMRRTIPRCYPDDVGKGEQGNKLNVTVDASNEFQSVGRYVTIYRRAVPTVGDDLSVSPFTIKTEKFDSEDRNRFPPDRTYPDVDGPILGREKKGIVFGDLLAQPNKTQSLYNVDDVSTAILIAHNLWVKLDAIERMRQLESALRRLDYGMRKSETAEMASIMSRLLHTSTNKGQISDLGVDLVTTTVGMWRIFKAGVSSAERYTMIDEIAPQARKLFGEPLKV